MGFGNWDVGILGFDRDKTKEKQEDKGIRKKNKIEKYIREWAGGAGFRVELLKRE